MWKTTEGSTGRLLQYCLGYFFFYTIFGVALKYFQGNPAQGFPGLSPIQFLVYSTVGGSVVALFVCLGLRWYRLRSNRWIQWGPLRFPSEYLYIIPSGMLTAVVIPTTTLMYSLPISVMVAMVIMRGAIIVVSRLVDAVQIRQGLLRKRVYRQENWAVVFALLAVGTTVFVTPAVRGDIAARLGLGSPAAVGAASGAFEFLHSSAAMTILGTYIVAYAIRIYIMNYYKNTRGKGVPLDNKGFFAIEQMAAFTTLVLFTLVLMSVPAGLTADGKPSPLAMFQSAIRDPSPYWKIAAVAGSTFGITAIFSVFLFMFAGRTATFAGLVNRLTSLVAGTASTLVFHFGYGGKAPSFEDWLSLSFILVAVALLTAAERRRAAELAATRELAPVPNPELRATGGDLQRSGTSRA